MPKRFNILVEMRGVELVTSRVWSERSATRRKGCESNLEAPHAPQMCGASKNLFTFL